jgi:hypothetical protein
MKRSLRILLSTLTLALACAVGSPPAWAYRPFDGTDGAVVDSGEIEIELGPVGHRQEGALQTWVAPALVYNYGFAKNWELVLQGQGEHPAAGTSHSSQLLGVGAFLKSVVREGVLQERSGASIATEFGFLLPGLNGQSGLGASFAGICTSRWGLLTLHLNASAAVTRQGHADVFLGTIAEGPFDWTVRPVAEVFYEHEYEVSETLSALIGVLWRSRPNHTFDVGVRSATLNGRHLSEIRAGLTFSFSA